MTQSTQKRGTSLLYELMAEANTYPDTIFMARGDPDFITPDHILAAARQAMADHAHDYSPPEGLLSLRQAITARIKRVNQIDANPETDIVVTNGGQESLFLMVLATIGAGDDLLVPEPSYNTYNDALRFAGGRKVSVVNRVEENFYADPDRVRKAITPQTKALLLVSPNNPSATVIPPADIRRFVAIAEEYDLVILSDEIYDMFLYDGHSHLSPASLPNGALRTLTLNASSKAYAMTGWRVGWIAGPADLMAQVKRLKAAITGPTSVIAQHAAVAALNGPQHVVKEMHDAYIRRRKLVMDTMDDLGIAYGIPQGGQFIFADIRPTGLDSVELAHRILREQHVLAYPGSGFGPDWDSYIRITFLQPEARLQEGLDRMKSVIAKLL